jgi:hypothetical protein
LELLLSKEPHKVIEAVRELGAHCNQVTSWLVGTYLEEAAPQVVSASVQAERAAAQIAAKLGSKDLTRVYPNVTGMFAVAANEVRKRWQRTDSLGFVMLGNAIHHCILVDAEFNTVFDPEESDTSRLNDRDTYSLAGESVPVVWHSVGALLDRFHITPHVAIAA